MMIDAEAAFWVWNNLYAQKQGTGTGKLSYKDQLQEKFRLENEMKEMREKQELTKRGYQVD